jgi:hypothetical protein
MFYINAKFHAGVLIRILAFLQIAAYLGNTHSLLNGKIDPTY